MNVWVLPKMGDTVVRVWRDSGGTVVTFPVWCPGTLREVSSETGDSCTPEEAAYIFSVYGVADGDALRAKIAGLCPICSVPHVLRPTNLPWPVCPEVAGGGAGHQ